jgi:hypothetical protein
MTVGMKKEITVRSKNTGNERVSPPENYDIAIRGQMSVTSGKDLIN